MKLRLPNNFQLRKTLFILPNLFTLGATFCALYSMLLASQATRPWDFWAAGWMIGLAGLLDGVDGRVARLTQTQSRFGLQIDSLADAISFGVAPAWLFYHWGLSGLWPVGFVIAFLYMAAAIIRLARFNLLSEDGAYDNRYFMGLPTPMAAAVPTCMVLVQSVYFQRFGVAGSGQLLVAGMVLFMALMMVSNIRFWAFRGLRMTRRNTALLIAALGAFVYISTATCLEMGLLAGFAGYVALHLAIVAVHFERRLTGKRPRDDEEVSPLPLGDDEEDDEEEELSSA